MGLTFAPLGALLPELFPIPVRYTGAASAYNLGGILGASFAPSLAQILEAKGGVAWVGYYIAVAAVISFLAVFGIWETSKYSATYILPWIAGQDDDSWRRPSLLHLSFAVATPCLAALRYHAMASFLFP